MPRFKVEWFKLDYRNPENNVVNSTDYYDDLEMLHHVDSQAYNAIISDESCVGCEFKVMGQTYKRVTDRERWNDTY
jgi:hypothetical protein